MICSYMAFIVQVFVMGFLISSERIDVGVTFYWDDIYIDRVLIDVDSAKVEDVFLFTYSGDTIVKYQFNVNLKCVGWSSSDYTKQKN